MIKTETLQIDRSEQQVASRNSSLIKPILPEVVGDLPNEDRTEQLVDVVLSTVFERLAVQKERVAILSNALTEYNKLAKETVGEERNAKKLVRRTAAKLLENPQDINYADWAWRRQEVEQKAAQDSQEPFSTLVKRECKVLIKEKWKEVAPDQLAQLVRIYSTNSPSKDFAKDLLRNYFEGEEAATKE